MQHDPLVCVEDAIKACKLISQFIQGMKKEDFYNDAKTKAAVEREIEIIGEALNRIKTIDTNLLAKVDNWREIIGFRNVIVWESIINDVPKLLNQLENIRNG